MKLKIIIFILLLFITTNKHSLYSQKNDLIAHEAEASVLQLEFENYLSQQEKLNVQINDLVPKIHILKEKEKLNYLQRYRLDGYLKSSQQLTEESNALQKKMTTVRTALESKWKELIARYDLEIDGIMNTLNVDALPDSIKKNELMKLRRIKNKREILQAKFVLDIREPADVSHLNLESSDDAQRLKENADWLIDQQEKLRADAVELDHIILNLKEEIEIREKMAELQQDISLFNPSDEPLAQQRMSQAAEIQDRSYGEATNAFLEDADKSRSSLFPLLNNITFDKEVSNISNVDIETIITRLDERKRKLLNTADSLTVRAKNLFRKADKVGAIKN